MFSLLRQVLACLALPVLAALMQALMLSLSTTEHGGHQ